MDLPIYNVCVYIRIYIYIYIHALYTYTQEHFRQLPNSAIELNEPTSLLECYIHI